MKLLGLLAGIAMPALAQDLTARLPIGGEAELRTRGLIVSSLRGKIAGVDSNHLRIAVTRAGSTVQIPWRSVDQLQWTRGKSRLRGLAEGALFGVLFGVSVFVSNYPFTLPDENPEKAAQIRRITQLGTAIAAGSTILGVAFGARKWYGAPIPRTTAGELALDLAAQDEVRVESTLGRITGRNGVAGDSLSFITSAGRLALPWRSIGELEVRAGRNRFIGILLGAGIGFVGSALAESFIDVSTAGFLTNVAVGGALGYRYLTPDGWKSLPIPSR